MRRNIIRLTESQLHNLIKESLKTLNESTIETNYDSNYEYLIKKEMNNLSVLEEKVPYCYKKVIHSMIIDMESILSEIRRNYEFENWNN